MGQNLIEATPKTKTADIDLEIDQILLSCAKEGNHHLHKAHSQILAALIIALLEKDITQDAKSTRQRAFFTQVRKLTLSQNPSRTTVVSIALEEATSVVKRDISEVLPIFFVTCTNLLPPVDTIAIACSVIQTHYHTKDEIKVSKLFIQTVELCLDKINRQKEKGFGDLLSADIAEHFLYVLSTHEPFLKDHQLNILARSLVHKLQKSYKVSTIEMESSST